MTASSAVTSVALEKKRTDASPTQILTGLLKTQYREQDHLPASPIDGRKHAIVAVQLSLIEAQKKAVLRPAEREALSDRGDAKHGADSHSGTRSHDAKQSGETASQQRTQPRTLASLLEKEESALDYYEAWHNVTTTLSVSEMLEQRSGEKPVRRALVMGPAGIGKTTLLHFIAHQWSIGAMWPERFQLVLWLPLRTLLKADYSEAKELSVAQLLYDECLTADSRRAIDVETFKSLLAQHSDKLLLLLDGYDECAVVVEEEKSALQGIFQALLRLGTVVLTSRPYRLQPTFAETFDRQFENRGFSNLQIQNYVTDYFKEQPKAAESLKQLLASQSRLQGMAHVPINLSLLCGLWQESASLSSSDNPGDAKAVDSENSALTQSLTQTNNLSHLYQQLTGYLVRRHLKERNEKVNITGIDNVVVLMDMCRSELNLLSRLAFLGLTQREILLSPKLLARLAQETRGEPRLLDETLRLGFLQKAGEGKLRGEIYTPHYFIHLSFQEFFTACYIAEGLKRPQRDPWYQEVRKFLIRKKYQVRYTMVLRFVSGLVSSDQSQDKALKAFWKALLSPPLDLLGIGHLSLMIRCLDEAWTDERVPYKKILWEEVLTAFKTVVQLEGRYLITPPLLSRLCAELQLTTTLIRERGLENTLLGLLRHEVEHVREAAASAVGQLGEKAATELVIQALLGYLKDNDAYSCYVQIAATAALGQLGEKAATEPMIQALLGCLKYEEERVRVAAASALGQLGKKAVTEPVIQILLGYLKNKDSWVRVAAASALRQIGEKAATEPVIQALLGCLKDEYSNVRKATAAALGKFGEKAAIDPVIQSLLGCLKDKDKWVQQTAASALWQLGEKAAAEPVIQTLLGCLKDKDKWVQQAAASVLWRLGEKTAAEPVIQTLLGCLKDKDWYARLFAASAFGQIGEKVAAESVIQALLGCLKDEYYNAREAAASALGQFGEKAATEPVIQALLGCLKDEAYNVRKAAAAALGKLGEKASTESVIQALLGCLEHEESEVRKAAAAALGQIGEKTATGPVIEALLRRLKDEVYYVRKAATQTLVNFPRLVVLQHYLQSSVSFWSGGVDKNYAQFVAKTLQQCTALIYDQEHLLLIDKQAIKSYAVSGKDPQTLVKALIKAFNNTAKLFGLPTTLTQAFLGQQEPYPIAEPAELSTVAVFDAKSSTARLAEHMNTLVQKQEKSDKKQDQAVKLLGGLNQQQKELNEQQRKTGRVAIANLKIAGHTQAYVSGLYVSQLPLFSYNTSSLSENLSNDSNQRQDMHPAALHNTSQHIKKEEIDKSQIHPASPSFKG